MFFKFKRTRRRMDRLRRSLRESFRRKKDRVPECSKPHQWQADEAAVRAGNCNFHVKYLGCVEVYESRGMQVCEEALKVLRNSRRRPTKGVLYVTGDGLRVVDDDTKGLIVDQTIEKVSFCAPDRNHERGFSYICRDGTTRRWMCHGFLATKEPNTSQVPKESKNLGERLSHAVGCAFAVCLEKKQRRDKECGVQMTFDTSTSTFTRTGSFRQTTLTERMQDPQDCKPAPEQAPMQINVANPYAVQRPHATVSMLERQGSFRGFSQLNQTSSPFKRQLSLRLDELPSTLERQQKTLSIPEQCPEMQLQNGNTKLPGAANNSTVNGWKSKNQQSLSDKFYMSPIPESSPVVENEDSISAMCQQLTQGLSLLSKNEDQKVPNSGNPWATSITTSTTSTIRTNVSDIGSTAAITETTNTSKYSPETRAKQWLTSSYSTTVDLPHRTTVPGKSSSPSVRRAPNLTTLRSQSVGAKETPYSSLIQELSAESTQPSSGNRTNGTPPTLNNSGEPAQKLSSDPFDAEWAAIATRHEPISPTNSNNPFHQNSFKTFEVHM